MLGTFAQLLLGRVVLGVFIPWVETKLPYPDRYHPGQHKRNFEGIFSGKTSNGVMKNITPFPFNKQ